MKWLLLIPVLLACSACNKGSQADPLNTKVQTSAGSDWKVAKNEKEGMSMQMPADWIAMDLSSKDFDKMLDAMGKENPQLEAMRGQLQQLADAGVYKLFLMQKQGKTPTGFTNNVNVIVLDAPANATLADAEKEAKADGEAKEVKRVKVGSHDAVMIVRTMPVTLLDGKKVTCEVLQYQLLAGPKAHMLSFSTTTDRSAEMRPVFEKMMNSYKTG